jgi:DNA-binding NarL/FixJ family response regulator
VNPIVAASAVTVRQQLAKLARSAHFHVQAITGDPPTLATWLQQEAGAWVVTGGSWAAARPFLRTARGAGKAVVAVLSGRADAEDRADLEQGGWALLREVPTTEAFQAASVASRAGLSVWDPGLDYPTDSTEAIQAPLSPRERTVLELAGAGLSTKATARQLGISPNTVKFHMQAAFNKLGVTSRAEAVMAAIRRGELAL